MRVIYFLALLLIIKHTAKAQNIGIGDGTPSAKLSILGTETSLNGQGAAIKIRNSASANAWYLRTGANGTTTPIDGFSIADNSGYHLNITSIGNTGLGIIPSGAKLHINGGVKIEGLNFLEFGAGIAGKEANAGRIVYNGFGTNALAIVGAGTTNTNRRLHFFAEGGAIFEAPVQINRLSFFDGGAVIGNFGAVNGNFNVNGKITRGQTGSTNLVPICMGLVGQFGEVVSGTGNFSVFYNESTREKDITINGETYTDEGYITIVTNIRQFEGVNFAMTKAVNGKLRVTQSPGGSSITGPPGNTTVAFHFVVYKL